MNLQTKCYTTDEFLINTNTTYTPNYPSAAGIDDNFVVTWDRFDGSQQGIYGQLFSGDTNATKIGNEFQVNTYTNNTQTRPSATGLLNGNFVVTWQSAVQGGSLYGIYGQIFTDTSRPSPSKTDISPSTDVVSASSQLSSGFLWF